VIGVATLAAIVGISALLLAKAAALQPSNVRYSYVYAVALNSTGQPGRAIAVL
jgi:hypothetical protein